MNVNQLTKALQALQINVKSTQAGDAYVDADIAVTERISVQVPARANPSVTHALNNGNFMCYPPRATLTALVADVRTALGMQ
jgi:hypothetical protein